MPRSEGFTLIELAIALVVAGIVLATGLPAFTRYRDSLLLRQAETQLLQDVRRARQLAVTRRAPVVMRFGAPPNYRNITQYSIHIDTNADNLVTSGESAFLRTLPSSTKLDSVCLVSQIDSVTFDISGTLRPGSQGGTFYLSNARGRRDTLALSAAGICYRP